MGEAKRRLLASTTSGGPAPAGMPGGRFPMPDFGRALWPEFREVPIFASFEPVALHDRGDAREVTGRVETDLGDGTKRYCVTVRTTQTRAEVVAIVGRARAAGGWCFARGRLDEAEVVGDSGERYRMVLGELEAVAAD